MGVPTIAPPPVPAAGPTRGVFLVELAGTNFRTPTPPPVSGPTSRVLKPSVEVFVGGRKATDVAVVSGTQLFFVAPRGDAGARDILVRNIDDDGVPIPGETVTAVGAFTYQMPNLDADSDFLRLLRTLIRELKRQVTPEVVISTSTDWAAIGAAVVQIGKFPAIVLAGFDLPENRMYSTNEVQEEPVTPSVTFQRRRTPYTVDVETTLLCLTNDQMVLLNLEAVVADFFNVNTFLEMDRDASDPSKGTVRFELDSPQTGYSNPVSTNLSDIRSFSVPLVLRGFNIEAPQSFADVVAKGGVIQDNGVLLDLQDY